MDNLNIELELRVKVRGGEEFFDRRLINKEQIQFAMKSMEDWLNKQLENV